MTSPAIAFLIILASFIVLDLVAWRWGADTRVGRDWQWGECRTDVGTPDLGIPDLGTPDLGNRDG